MPGGSGSAIGGVPGAGPGTGPGTGLGSYGGRFFVNNKLILMSAHIFMVLNGI